MYNSTRPGLNQRKSQNKLGQGIKILRILFFPYCIKKQPKLSDEIRSAESKQFKEIILDFIRSNESSIYAIHDISGLKLLTRLRLDFVT